MSDSLRSLTKNELPWAIPSGRSEEMSDVSESLIFGQQTSDSLGNKTSEFPALSETYISSKWSITYFKNTVISL